jgi:hypothetical protein
MGALALVHHVWRLADALRQHPVAEGERMTEWLHTLKLVLLRRLYPRRIYHIVDGVVLPGAPGDPEHEMARRLIGAGPSAQAWTVTPLRWHERVLQRLFPSVPCPRHVAADDVRPYICTDVHASLDWKDRLRVLLTGNVRVQVVTYTDVVVNEASSRSVVDVPWRHQR